jgi:hypothetical protein
LLHIRFLAAGLDPLLHLPAVDGNTAIDLEAQSYLPAANVKHRDLEQVMKTIGPADHDRFAALPR